MGRPETEEERPMLFAIHYVARPSAGSKADTAALMKEFGERGEVAGTVAHYA